VSKIRIALAMLAAVVASMLVGVTPALAAGCTGTPAACLYYAGGAATPAANQTGFYVAADVVQPTINTAKGDKHTLMEITVQDTVHNNTIELGWNVDPTLYSGSTVPHLFTFYWVNGVPQGYNTGLNTNAQCGGITPTVAPGSVITGTLPLLKKFGIEHVGTWPNGAWWFAYDTGWSGCIFDSNLVGKGISAPFDSGDYFQAFGEVASTRDNSTPTTRVCAGMGNNLPAGIGAARIANASFQSGAPYFPALALYTGTGQGGTNVTSNYTVAQFGSAPWSGRSLTYGGIGPATNPPC
jgi:hypothetical protein